MEKLTLREKQIVEFIEENSHVGITIKDIAFFTDLSRASCRKYAYRLLKKGVIKQRTDKKSVRDKLYILA